jgi:hypothetical protein
MLCNCQQQIITLVLNGSVSTFYGIEKIKIQFLKQMVNVVDRTEGVFFSNFYCDFT